MDFYLKTHLINGELCIVELLDILGQDIYSNFRAEFYPRADIFILCFDVMSPSGFQNLRTKFVPEIQRLSPGTPFILVGTKSDLSEKWATGDLGERLARTVGALTYMECSALTNHGVRNVFEEVNFDFYLISLLNGIAFYSGILLREREKQFDDGWDPGFRVLLEHVLTLLKTRSWDYIMIIFRMLI